MNKGIYHSYEILQIYTWNFIPLHLYYMPFRLYCKNIYIDLLQFSFKTKKYQSYSVLSWKKFVWKNRFPQDKTSVYLNNYRNMAIAIKGSSPPKKIEQWSSWSTLSYQDWKFNFTSQVTVKELYFILWHFYLLQNVGSVEIVDNILKFQ